MIKKLKLEEEFDCWDSCISQTIIDKEENKEVFSVHNLYECPEDAIIGRDLFTAHDFINAIRYGMRLANKGYTEVTLDE